MNRQISIACGFFIWLAIGGLIWHFGWQQNEQRVSRLREEISGQISGKRQRVVLYMDKRIEVGIGDPVFIEKKDGSFEQVGEVATIPASIPLRFGASEKVRTGELLLYAKMGQIGSDSTLTLYETPESLAWVMSTMLPPKKRKEIAEVISSAFEEHQEEIIYSLQPIIEAGLRESLAVVEQDLEAALLARSNRLEEIGARYQTDMVESEIVPLVRREIFPIVREHGEPLANEIGREIWNEASLWRFGWRYMYDISPLPQRDLARREFNRFVDAEAIPILESHIDDFIRMQQDVFTDVAKNPRVRDVVRNSLQQIVRDPEVQGLLIEIVREVFVDNPRLKTILRRHWSSPEAKRALQIASQRMEPTAVAIGELLFGSPEKGVTEEFSRVLRNQVLKKDRRWIVLRPVRVEENNEAPSLLVLEMNRGNTVENDPFAFSAGMLR